MVEREAEVHLNDGRVVTITAQHCKVKKADNAIIFFSYDENNEGGNTVAVFMMDSVAYYEWLDE